MFTKISVLLILTTMTLKNFKKKLNLILLLEMMMMTIIFLMAEITQTNGHMSLSLYIMMTIFMVVDSVMGMSVLIFNSRNSTNFSFSFKF